LVLAIGIVFPVLTNEPQLLARSTSVADVNNWWEKGVHPEYEWLTEYLLFTACGHMEPADPFLYDSTRHVQTRIPALRALMSSHGRRWIESWIVSPDKVSVLWTEDLDRYVRVARLDGTGYREFKIASVGDVVLDPKWTTNNEWMAECIDRRTGDLHGGLRGDTKEPGTRYDMTRSELAHFDEYSGVQDEGTKVAVVSVEVLPSGIEPHRTVYINAPKDTRILDEATTLDRKRIALFVQAERSRPFANWIGKVWPAYAAKQYSIELWIGHTERDDLRRIGIIPNGLSHVSNLQWLPSNTKLSFIYESSLRTIKLD